MSLDPVTAVLDIGGKLIDKLWPDPVEAAKAKLALAQAQQNGELEEIRIQMSAILAEAQSADPWTSRARPTFMYVIYLVVLFGLPLSVMAIWYPMQATAVQQAFSAWVTGIPDSLWTLFGAGYLGYAGARTVEKIKR